MVLVKVNGHFIPSTELTQIPKNTVIDALHGTLTLTSAAGSPAPAHDAAAKGKKHKTPTQKGTFSGAIFKLSQATGGAGKGLVTLAIVENAFSGAPTYATCTKKAGDASAAALSGRTLQLLHASAKGKFSTRGRYSAATVRGTRWTIADRCDGTLTHDITDSVAVTDFVRHKTIILHAGQNYLARAPKVETRIASSAIARSTPPCACFAWLKHRHARRSDTAAHPAQRGTTSTRAVAPPAPVPGPFAPRDRLVAQRLLGRERARAPRGDLTMSSLRSRGSRCARDALVAIGIVRSVVGQMTKALAGDNLLPFRGAGNVLRRTRSSRCHGRARRAHRGLTCVQSELISGRTCSPTIRTCSPRSGKPSMSIPAQAFNVNGSVNETSA